MGHEELLEKYLSRSLNQEDQIAFDLALKSDQVFLNEYNRYNDLIKGIRLYGRQSIESEVNAIHKDIMPSILENMAFETDVVKALRFKNRESIKNEIWEAMSTLSNSGESTQENIQPTQRTEIVSISRFRVVAIAASVIVLVTIGILFIKKENNQGVIWNEAMAQSFESMGIDAQQVGLVDPDQPFRVHQQFIFKLLDQNKIDSAKTEHDKYYANQIKDAKYFIIEGCIQYVSKNNAKALESFRLAMQSGDTCLGKLLYAFMQGKNNPESKKQIEQVKQSAICQSSELIKGILQKLAL